MTPAAPSNPSPRFSDSKAAELLETHYGLRGSCQPLASERDQNFCVEADNGQRYVLKIANSAEDPAVIDLQVQALQHIAQHDPGLPVPRTIPAKDNQLICQVIDANGVTYPVRLISWLDGRIMQEVPTTPALLNDLGVTQARLVRSLQSFRHPAADHFLIWDIKNAAKVAELLDSVANDQHRLRLQQVFDRFCNVLEPQLPHVRWQIVHCDLNRGNVLVDNSDAGKVSGVIDFGDMVHTPLVADLAITAAYHFKRTDHPLADALHLIRAYHSVFPLTGTELAMLYDLMKTRLACSSVLQVWRANQYPELAAYLMQENQYMKDMLQHLSGFDQAELRQSVLDACSEPGVP